VAHHTFKQLWMVNVIISDDRDEALVNYFWELFTREPDGEFEQLKCVHVDDKMRPFLITEHLILKKLPISDQ